jgi:6-phosphogluconolactonase (cycloisomerase 2 family)
LKIKKENTMSPNLKGIAITVALAASVLLQGCGSNSNPTPCNCTNASSSSYLYASISNSVSTFKLGTDGAPTAVSSLAGPNDSTGIVADPSGKFVYVSDFGNGEIDAFTINASGALTKIPGSPFSTGPSPTGGLGVDPQTRFLYLPNNFGILGYTINSSTGALTPIAGSPFPGSAAIDAVVDPTGKFLYASNNGDAMGTISAYSIDPASGALTLIAGSPFVTQSNFPGPAGFAFGGGGKFLYVGMSGTANANHVISGFAVDPTTGALTQLAASPFSAGNDPGHIASDAKGKFLFSANAQDNTVSAFAIDSATGNLTAVAGSPFDAGGAAVALAVDATGTFVYVGMQPSALAGTSGLSAFSINGSSGVLTRLAGSPFASGEFFFGVAIAKP